MSATNRPSGTFLRHWPLSLSRDRSPPSDGVSRPADAYRRQISRYQPFRHPTPGRRYSWNSGKSATNGPSGCFLSHWPLSLSRSRSPASYAVSRAAVEYRYPTFRYQPFRHTTPSERHAWNSGIRATNGPSGCFRRVCHCSSPHPKDTYKMVHILHVLL